MRELLSGLLELVVETDGVDELFLLKGVKITGVILLCICVENRNLNTLLSVGTVLSFTSILSKSLEICDCLFSVIIPLCVIEYPHFTDKVLIDFLALCREFGRAES